MGEEMGMGDQTPTMLLAEAQLEAIPEGAAWVAREVRLEPDEVREHAHEFAFVYVREGGHVLDVGDEQVELRPGEGAAIDADQTHRHAAKETSSVFWEIRLAEPESTPSEAPDARPVFESERLEGVPSGPNALFVHVLVPSQAQTVVHTHPGTELIYQLSGRIAYENALIGVVEMGPGDIEGMPPEVAVQKRNPFEEDAEFLSWFLLDPDEPFLSPARFQEPEIEGENVALLEKGARVADVSSNFGNGGMAGPFGANNVLDGDPATEWSSAGDGDGAWIEIQLDRRYRIAAIGVQTRTMGATAQVASFRVVTDAGEEFGPFDLPDAGGIYAFSLETEAERLRLEVVSSSGGNTGFVDVQVFAAG